MNLKKATSLPLLWICLFYFILTDVLGACYTYDFDCDNDVDIVDVMSVASRWMKNTGDPDFDVQYDFDGDGDIDEVDIMMVADYWGWHPRPPGVRTLTNSNAVRYVEIMPGETHYYEFNIPEGTQAMLVSMGTNDWKTNQDMMFSLGLPYPTTNDYPVGESFTVNGQEINGSRKWARIAKGGSNESYLISSDVIPGTYFVMVYNTSSLDGLYELYYYSK
jgi:hypothetical protein